MLLFVGLAGIVLLAEAHRGGRRGRAGQALQVKQADAIVGAFIATLVLMPESLAAIRASLNNELQRSLNIALGSACATIGLTIPAVAAASLITGKELTLGLGSGDTVLLLLGLGVSIISFGTGRTTVLTGLVHLVVFCAYVFLIFFPMSRSTSGLRKRKTILSRAPVEKYSTERRGLGRRCLSRSDPLD